MMKVEKSKRQYFPENLDVSNWEPLKKESDALLEEKWERPQQLIQFLEKVTELESIISEHAAWLYINMTRYADKPEHREKFNDFFGNVIAKTQKYDFQIKKKFYDSPLRKDLMGYEHLNRIISNDIELFREENIPLSVEEQKLANKYGEKLAGMTVEFQGEEKTLQQMGIYLKDKDRAIREEAFMKSGNCVVEESNNLDKLFDDLKEIRIKEAKNAGFDNYRDYAHQRKGRFSYTPNDIREFHGAVEKVVIPFLKEESKKRKQKLGVDTLRPWDMSVELDGKTLKPFDTIDEFVDKSVEVLNRVDPEFGEELMKMKNSGFLDLENRKGKAPGGYCYPLMEHNSSFIFMNAVGLHRDLTTLVHESGHTMHNLMSKDLKLSQYKSYPSEIAELASMSMEFLTMDNWHLYYDNEEDLNKAKREQIKGALDFLPWCMIVDAFQQWIYTNPDHSAIERRAYFAGLMDRFNAGADWTGLDDIKRTRWMRQLHIFEVPFYYIEYGISQLGALAVYKNYKENPEKAVKNYKNFLKVAYSKPMDEVYETAGIKFDFSAKYIGELVDFVKKELAELGDE